MTEDSIPAVRLLVVSKESAVLRPLWSLGQLNSWQIETVGSSWDALERVQSGTVPDLLLLDVPRGDMERLQTLRWLRRMRPELPILLVGHGGDAEPRKEAIRLGAREYLQWPLRENELELAIRSHLSSRSDKVDNEIEDGIEEISEDAFFIGASPVMQKVRLQAELLAQANFPVLIVGEKGSEKEAVARLIHKVSARAGQRFHKVNCAALSSGPWENTLFGSAPIGRKAGRPGPEGLEAGASGTIFFDEVSELPMSSQAKLLYVLKQGHFAGAEAAEADLRVMAATSANLGQSLAEGSLREDLYCRLSAFSVYVPPLRERKEDIPLLLANAMKGFAKHYDLPAKVFSSKLLQRCQAYSWPGNLRELETFVKRYLVMEGEEAALSNFQREGDSPRRGASTDGPQPGFEVPIKTGAPGLKLLVKGVKGEAERNAIASALEQTHWNRKAAARLLKVSYRTLLYKIQQYHMAPREAEVTNWSWANGAKSN